jgi:hypothetical protein
MIALAGKVNQYEKQYAIPMGKIILRGTIQYAECFLNEHGPAVVAPSHASYDTGYYPAYIQVVILAVAPESQGMPYFNGLQGLIPVPVKKVAEDSRNCVGTECRMGRIQAGDEPTGSGWFGDRIG